MSAAQHTPGPWQIARSLYRDDPRPFTVYRDAGTPHYALLLDKRGRERRFATEADARAAIAKATGSPYNAAQIAWELERSAVGDGHYGNALRVAKDIPGITDEDRSLLDRYATGRNGGTDHVALQDLALRVAKTTRSAS